MTRGISAATRARFNPTADPSVIYKFAPTLDASTRAQIAGLARDKAVRVAFLAGFDSGLYTAFTDGGFDSGLYAARGSEPD